MSSNIQIPEILTSRLRLRAFVPEDAQPLYSILQQDDILKYFPNPQPPEMDRVERLIQRQIENWETYSYGWWAVVPYGQENLVGWNGLQYLPETNEVEVGYLLSKPFWGNGLATDGAQAALEFGFATLDLEEIIGLVHPENIASQRVLEKSGLIFTNRAEYFGMELMRYCIHQPTT